MVPSIASSIVDVGTLYIDNGIFISFDIIWQYVRSVETKSSEIIATLFGPLFLRKYAMIELSNPPDNEIKLD
jgi:hypothetical protein